jgi:hypothetical protein
MWCPNDRRYEAMIREHPDIRVSVRITVLIEQDQDSAVMADLIQAVRQVCAYVFSASLPARSYDLQNS